MLRKHRFKITSSFSVWNSDWFRFDVDDRELQDEPLHIRIMDYDTYSANDAIGKVYIVRMRRSLENNFFDIISYALT